MGVSDCEEWQGNRDKNGYGRRRYKGSVWLVHRAAWDEQVGPIPEGMVVMHKCDNPPCIKINHLTLGSMKHNSEDMVAKKRQYHGERHWKSKLSTADVQDIRKRYAAGGVKQIDLAAEYGVGQDQISRVINFKNRATA